MQTLFDSIWLVRNQVRKNLSHFLFFYPFLRYFDRVQRRNGKDSAGPPIQDFSLTSASYYLVCLVLIDCNFYFGQKIILNGKNHFSSPIISTTNAIQTKVLAAFLS